MAGTTYGSGAVIFPSGIGKLIVIINSNNLGFINSFYRFTGLTSGLINFYNWSNLI